MHPGNFRGRNYSDVFWFKNRIFPLKTPPPVLENLLILPFSWSRSEISHVYNKYKVLIAGAKVQFLFLLALFACFALFVFLLYFTFCTNSWRRRVFIFVLFCFVLLLICSILIFCTISWRWRLSFCSFCWICSFCSFCSFWHFDIRTSY